MKNKIKILLSLITMIAIDQIAKILVKTNNIDLSVIKYFENYNKQSLDIFIIITIATFSILIISMIFIKNKSTLYKNGIIMIFAGGISNMIDIIIKQSVTDYLIVGQTNINLSDIYTIIGWLLIIIELGTTLYKKQEIQWKKKK